jgi:hypothetical protein
MNCSGFKTAQGSTYAVTGDGKTLRYKNSSGHGQHEIHAPSICLFAPSQAINAFERYFFGTGHLDNAIRLGKTSGNLFTPFSDRTFNCKKAKTPPSSLWSERPVKRFA